jgi:hypothetical protein
MHKKSLPAGRLLSLLFSARYALALPSTISSSSRRLIKTTRTRESSKLENMVDLLGFRLF